jgi:hypothetical protein
VFDASQKTNKNSDEIIAIGDQQSERTKARMVMSVEK